MMFTIPLMCCEYRGVSLLTGVQQIKRATALCYHAFNGSKDALCIHQIALELSVNAKMCET